MPELPEVEYGRKLVHEAAVGRRIVEVECAHDPIVIAGTDPKAVQQALRGATVTGTGRRGKYLWLELNRRPWLLVHFGMTGAFVVPGTEALQLESSPKKPDATWPPRFTKLHLVLSDGGEVAFINKRRLGRVRLVNDPLHEPPVSALGFDPLLDPPPLADFRRRLARRSGPIKAVLLDQSFAAGVGNWVADEVLFQAGIDPRRRANQLSPEESKRLLHSIKQVIRTAVRVDARKSRFPKSWLFHHRWDKKAGAKTSRGDAIQHITVGGRTTAFVPAVQK